MGLMEIGFGGLEALDCDEKIPINSAFECVNAYVDASDVRGRNGYRAMTASAIGSGLSQAVVRFRPTSTSARTIVVRGGHVYVVTDPSSETASDGAVTDLGLIFNTTTSISTTQYGRYLYLASSESPANWKRMNSSYTLESITSLPQPALPAVATTNLTLTLLSALAAPTLAGGMTSGSSGVTDWTNLAGTIGGTAIYNFGVTYDWTSTKWLFVACSPETTSGGGGTFAIEVATAAGNFEQLAVIGDTPGDGSPYAAYLSLQGLTSATRSAVRRLRFRQVGPTTDPFSVSSFMPVSSAPAPGEVDYYLSYYNSVTGQESQLSDKTIVIYSSDNVTPPTFHAARWNYNSFFDYGTKSTNPDSFPVNELWNKGANVSSPSSSEFALIRTFSGNVPLASRPAAADTVRLWRLTSVGIRLVGTSNYTTRADGSAWTAAGSTGTASDLPVGATFWDGSYNWSIADTAGDSALSHQQYKAGGTPPPCIALAAINGRLVAGGDPSNPNRVSISSYLPFGQTSDPFPQFPAVPIIAADGWSFDIAPTSSEGILQIVRGDHAAYFLTNEATYFLSNLDAPLFATPPIYKVWERGAISRRSAWWAEEALYWVAHDGMYVAQARAFEGELTKKIRRLFRGTFQPDSTAVLCYQDRKLLAIRGTAAIRFDFVTETWTRHTLAHTMLHAEAWRDPTGIYQNMVFLDSAGNAYRWQPGLSPTDANRATTDGGATIPAWIYSTGFSFFGGSAGDAKSRVRSVFADLNGGTGTVNIYKDATSTPLLTKAFPAGEHQEPINPSLTAYKWRFSLTAQSNSVQLRRLMVERTPVQADGA